MAPNQVDTTMGGDITPPPRLSQRLGAMLYDALLLAAVVVLAGLPLPLIPEQTQTQPLLRLLIQLYLVSVCFVFFGWFWVHGGQTLGMRAWRVKLTRSDDRPVDWRHAGIRFVSACISWLCLGLGFLWSVLDCRGRAWHDIWSDTYLRQQPKPRRQ